MKRKISIVLLVVLAVGLLAGCCEREEKKISEELFKYKTEYVGDNSKVGSILNTQKYLEGATPDNFEINSEKEPYSLTLNLLTEVDLTDNDLFKNAVVTFALIGNLQEINYSTVGSNDNIATFSREDVENTLDDMDQPDLAEIGKSQKNLEKFMES